MDSFKIASYKVSTYIQRVPSQTRFERLLELEAEPVAHGYVSRALLAFNTFFTHPWTTPVVGYLTFTPSSISTGSTSPAWMTSANSTTTTAFSRARSRSTSTTSARTPAPSRPAT